MFNAETGIEFDNDTGELLFNHGGCRPLTAVKGGGTFHGHWGTESMDVAPSDRSLKENIQPVFETLLRKHRLTGDGAAASSRRDAAEAVFQKLRPVSYNFRPEQGRERFGFIADEMLEVLPEMTRVSQNRERTMGILYQDLLAVLLTRMQDMVFEMHTMGSRLTSIESRTQQRKDWRRSKARR